MVPQQQTLLLCLGRQETPTDCCAAHSSGGGRNAGSATLSAYVVAERHTDLSMLEMGKQKRFSRARDI